MSELELLIRHVLRDHAHLAVDAVALDEDASLFDAGMTSHASVNVLVALEDAFAVEFPDAMLTPAVFESVASLRAAVATLTAPVS